MHTRPIQKWFKKRSQGIGNAPRGSTGIVWLSVAVQQRRRSAACMAGGGGGGVRACTATLTNTTCQITPAGAVARTSGPARPTPSGPERVIAGSKSAPGSLGADAERHTLPFTARRLQTVFKGGRGAHRRADRGCRRCRRHTQAAREQKPSATIEMGQLRRRPVWGVPGRLAPRFLPQPPTYTSLFQRSRCPACHSRCKARYGGEAVGPCAAVVGLRSISLEAGKFSLKAG